ncbi:MAG: TMEM198/TM7SF3 family protein [Puniceicoccaceae bacterium]|nr:MAG: TMEM198/TM7SF3 family protein [Puniceicoccaceae bacterium]
MTSLDPSFGSGSLVLVFLGVINCLHGYRAFRVSFSAAGFLGGWFLGWSLGEHLLPGAWWFIAGMAALGAVSFGLTAWSLYLLGVFVLTGGLGLMAGLVVFGGLGDLPALILAGILAAISGGLGLAFQKPLVIAGTSAFGALAIVLGTGYFVTGLAWPVYLENPDRIPDLLLSSPLILAATLTLGILGIARQSADTARERIA